MKRLIGLLLVVSLILGTPIMALADEVDVQEGVLDETVETQDVADSANDTAKDTYKLLTDNPLDSFVIFDLEAGNVLSGVSTWTDPVTETDDKGNVTVVEESKEVVDTSVLFKLESEEYITLLNSIKSEIIKTVSGKIEDFVPSQNSEEFLEIPDWGSVLYNFAAGGKTAVGSYSGSYFVIEVNDIQYSLRLDDAATRMWIDTVLVPIVRSATYEACIPMTYNIFDVRSIMISPMTGYNVKGLSMEDALDVGFKQVYSRYVHPILGEKAGTILDSEAEENFIDVVSLGVNYGYILSKEFVRLRSGEINGDYIGVRPYNGLSAQGLQPVQYVDMDKGGAMDDMTTALVPRPFIDTMINTAVPSVVIVDGDSVAMDISSIDNIVVSDILKYDFIEQRFYTVVQEKDSQGEFVANIVYDMGGLTDLKIALDDISILNFGDDVNVALVTVLDEVFADTDVMLVPTTRIAHIPSIYDVSAKDGVQFKGTTERADLSTYLKDGRLNTGYNVTTHRYYLLGNNENLDYKSIVKNLVSDDGKAMLDIYNMDVSGVSSKLKAVYVATSNGSGEKWSNMLVDLGLSKAAKKSGGAGALICIIMMAILVCGVFFFIRSRKQLAEMEDNDSEESGNFLKSWLGKGKTDKETAAIKAVKSKKPKKEKIPKAEKPKRGLFKKEDSVPSDNAPSAEALIKATSQSNNAVVGRTLRERHNNAVDDGAASNALNQKRVKPNGEGTVKLSKPQKADNADAAVLLVDVELSRKLVKTEDDGSEVYEKIMERPDGSKYRKKVRVRPKKANNG